MLLGILVLAYSPGGPAPAPRPLNCNAGLIRCIVRNKPYKYDGICLSMCAKYFLYGGQPLRALDFCLALKNSSLDGPAAVGDCVTDVAFFTDNIAYCDYISYAIAKEYDLQGPDPIPSISPIVRPNPPLSPKFDDDTSKCKDDDHLSIILQLNGEPVISADRSLCDEYERQEEICYEKIETYNEVVKKPCLGLLFALGWLVVSRP